MIEVVKSRRIIVGALALLLAGLGLTGCSTTQLERFEATETMMDTFVSIAVYAPDKATGEAAIGTAFGRMREIEAIASIYDEAAEAYRLNRDGVLEAPPADLKRLLELSAEYSEITDGNFDITVQPLLDLWSGGLWQEPEAVQQQRISETLALVDRGKVIIEDDRVYFTEPEMKITLGGIAKGYAVDEALKAVKKQGVKNALINAGGDMACIGSKPDNEPWLVALYNPDDPGQSLTNFVIKNGKAVTTSGNYARYFDPDQEAAHILNPKTGYSAQGLISVSIIADTATQADALATAVFVMGPEAGGELVESLSNVECFIVSEDHKIYISSGLATYAAPSEQGE
jgi:thiamine biosynthesis lipoprotein